MTKKCSLTSPPTVSPTGMKPFKCNICHASFTTNGSLNRHMISHMKSYKCTICDESFRTNLLRKKHMRKEHDVEEQSKTAGVRV